MNSAINGESTSAESTPAESTPELGAELLAIARRSIAKRLGLAVPETADGPPLPRLDQPGASFVTLTRNGSLRGCIGTLQASRTLSADVAENACAAAFRDPRFPPVSAAEWPSIQIEVSLLAEPEPLVVANEAAACEVLRPGVDGVILECGARRATFLPQVWDTLPKPRDFLAHLKEKAGLQADFWRDDLRISRYTVHKWKESS